MQGCIFNIQRFTVHDGPGIRTEVFLKGCPLSCRWCSNPEGQAAHPEPGLYPSRCLGRDACGLCAQALGEPGVVTFDEAGKICSVSREAASGWEAAACACPTGALKSWGEHMSVDAVMEVVERDRSYYETSGGGVTVSGGEPLVQAAFAAKLLGRCHEAGIHTCLETTLSVPWNVAKPVLDEADLLIVDVKCLDSQLHARCTGRSNEAVLENLVRAADETDQIIVRVPVIPGFNDDAGELAAIRAFLVQNLLGRIREVQLLEFMHLGEEKCRSLERRYPYEGYEFNRDDLHGAVRAMRESLMESGFACTLGGAAKKE